MGPGMEGPDSSSPPARLGPCSAYVDLYWMPLGAGGWFVRGFFVATSFHDDCGSSRAESDGRSWP
jgi:hypothetical protein